MSSVIERVGSELFIIRIAVKDELIATAIKIDSTQPHPMWKICCTAAPTDRSHRLNSQNRPSQQSQPSEKWHGTIHILAELVTKSAIALKVMQISPQRCCHDRMEVHQHRHGTRLGGTDGTSSSGRTSARLNHTVTTSCTILCTCISEQEYFVHRSFRELSPGYTT